MRDQFNAFVERNEIAWELAMASLAIVYVAIGFAWDAGGPAQPALEAVDAALTLIFLGEFTLRIGMSRDRLKYLRVHLIDLVALIPIARGVRIFRLLRLLRLVRAFAGMRRAFLSAERMASHHGLGSLVIAWFGTMFLCSWAFLIAESGANPRVDDVGDAIWWGLMTLTGGATATQAVTPEGQWITATLLVVGVALFTAITAVLVSFIVRSDTRAMERGMDLRELKAMVAEGLLTEDDYTAAKLRFLSGLEVRDRTLNRG